MWAKQSTNADGVRYDHCISADCLEKIDRLLAYQVESIGILPQI